MAQNIEQLLESLSSLWLNHIELATEAKKRDFDVAAEHVMRYAGREYRPIRFEEEDLVTEGAARTFTITNYTQAFIDIMTPYVWASVPNRLVSPRAPQIPPELDALVPQAKMWQDVAKKRDTLGGFLLQWWLNFAPDMNALASEGKKAVQEAFGKGRGCLWLEMINSPVGPIPASNADSVDNLRIDPDSRTLKDAGWIVRKREEVNYKIHEEWGEPLENLRGSDRTSLSKALSMLHGDSEEFDPGKIHDKSVYYEVWSVIGLGEKLFGADTELTEDNPLMDALEALGPYVHFAVMPGVKHPLGMGPDVVTAVSSDAEFLSLMQARLTWPIKTYEDPDNPWPMKPLDFRPCLDKPWPRPLLEQALPLQEFIDRIYTTLLTRARTAGRDIVVTSTEIEEDLEAVIREGPDLSHIKINGDVPEALEKLIGFIRFPEIKRDILEILEIADRAWRELTGMDHAQFGGIPRTQDRSAEATQVREAGLARRPDDYADTVEAWMSTVGAGEGVAARMMVSADTISRVLHENIQDAGGEDQKILGPLTSAWVEFVHTDDPAVAAAEVAYTVEAGSGRRKNKQLLQENANRMYDMLGGNFFEFGVNTSQFKPFTALVRMVGVAFDMPVEPLISEFETAVGVVTAHQQALQQAQQGALPAPQGPPPSQNPL